MPVFTSAAAVGWMVMSMFDISRPHAIAAPEATVTPAVAVVAFDTDRTAWLPPAELGATVADLIAHALVESGRYRVLDREWLEDSLDWPSGPASAGRAQSRARVPMAAWRDAAARSGVRYLVTGSVTRFTTEQTRRSFGGSALRVLTLGGYRRESTASVIGLAIRMIDLETGAVAASAMVQGESGRKNVSVGALGLIGVLTRRPSLAGAGFSSGSRGSRDAMLSEALAKAVDRGARMLMLPAADSSADRASRGPIAARLPEDRRSPGLPAVGPVR